VTPSGPQEQRPEPTGQRRLKELFAAAIRKPAAERESFLREACAGEPALLADLTDLLHLAAETEVLVGPHGGAAEAFAGATTDLEQLARGDSLGRYLILERIGAGGMGVVYAAYDPELDRRVAVKVLRAGRGGAIGEDRLLREAQAMARLAHPNVIAVHDVGTVSGRVFLAMEHVAGSSLRERLAGGPLPWREALDLLVEAGRGLAAAHRGGLVHRDFKPDNVLVGDDGRVRVLDFGLARSPDEPLAGEQTVVLEETPSGPREPTEATITPRRALLASPLTHVGTVVGTPAYMAPEQLGGAGAGPAADQFSFCVTLWEAIFGERPFAGRTVFELASAYAAATVREPPGVAAPRWLRAALRRGLAGNPAQRHADMEELLAALRPPNRPWQVGAAAALVLVVGGGFWAATRSPACGDGTERLAGVWDGPRQEAVHAALLATRRPFAPAVAADVRRELDGYAAQWSRLFRASCESHRHGALSAELLDLRMQCLDRRLGDLDAAAGVLARADAGVAERAVQVAASLPNLTLCTDAAALRGRQPLPALGPLRAKVDAAHRSLSRARALGDAGRWQEALDLARASESAAREAGYRPLIAESLLLAAEMREVLADTDGARDAFAAALVAAEAAADRALKVRAAASEGRLLAYRLSRMEEGEWWLQLAQAALGSEPDPQLAASLAAARGVVRRAQGRYQEALPDLERNVALRTRLYGPDHLQVAIALNSLGNLFNEMGRPADAERAYRRSLTIQRAHYGSSHPAVGRLLNNLGTTLRNEKRYAEARASLEEALAIYERVFTGPVQEIGSTVYNLGNLANDTGDWQAGLRYHERAMALARELYGERHLLVAQALNGSGNSLQLARRYPEALERFDRALRLFEEMVGPEHEHVAYTLQNVGITLEAMGRDAEAVAPFQRALAIYTKTLGPDHPYCGEMIASLGGIDARAGRVRQAREKIERGLALMAKEPSEAAVAAEARLVLAGLVLGEDPARARALAREAEAAFATLGSPRREAARAWLRAHGGDTAPHP
jgi:tetratricopeptide (TPR) repeat protein/tRNA A-37 threonylcarbamoyl transferase component Bud32